MTGEVEKNIDTEGQILRDINLLGIENYGDGYGNFLITPRESLGGRSPEEAILQGDAGDVLSGLAATSEGSAQV